MNSDSEVLFQDDYREVIFPPDREWQQRALLQLREGFKAGHKRQILVAPTGSGKTIAALKLLHGSLVKGRRALFVCDRTVLINQTSSVADSLGLTAHGIIQANHPRRANHLRMQIASVQTLQARKYWPATDLIIIDEAHTQFETIRERLARDDCAVIGLTATPCTKGLGKHYTALVNGATMHELTDQGVLVPLRIFTCVTPDMAGAETSSSGEWSDKAASEREVKIVGDVVAEWQKHGENRKTIAFGPDIAYCRELFKRFDAAGIQAACYHSETEGNLRESLAAEFKKPDSGVRILISVEALAKGFDQPDVGCIIDARPLRKSLSTAIQMWGRGLRSSPSTGKTDCLLLDFSGNIRRFYDDFTDVYFDGFKSLDDGEQADRKIRKDELEFEPKGCPKCHHTPFRRKCLKCGYEKESHSRAEEVAGTMKEIRIGKEKAADSRAHLWQQLCHYAAKAKSPHGRAWHLFKDITGTEPPVGWRWHSTAPVAPTAATLRKIQQLNIAFARGKQAGAARAYRAAKSDISLKEGFERSMAE